MKRNEDVCPAAACFLRLFSFSSEAESSGKQVFMQTKPRGREPGWIAGPLYSSQFVDSLSIFSFVCRVALVFTGNKKKKSKISWLLFCVPTSERRHNGKKRSERPRKLKKEEGIFFDEGIQKGGRPILNPNRKPKDPPYLIPNASFFSVFPSSVPSAAGE